MSALTFARRRLKSVLVVLFATVLFAGAASGQMGQLSRAIGEAAGSREESSRNAVSPSDLVETEGSASSVGAAPEALAFSEPEIDAATPGSSSPAAETPLPDPEASSVAGGSVTPQPPAANPRPEPDGPAQPSPTPTTSEEPAAVEEANDVASLPSAAPAEPTVAGADGPGHVVSLDGIVRGGEFDGRTFSEAVGDATPGDRFLFVAGNHAPIHVDGVDGASGSPIVIGAADPSDPPNFTSGSYDRSAGIFISDSSHIVLQDLEIRRSLWGILVERSTNVTMERVDARDLGQEGIRIAERSGFVTIRNSTIADTGRRPGTSSLGQPYSNFGEGIYLGNGSSEDDPVHDVTITNNNIFGTGTEAIDVKAPVTNVLIRGNAIHDINTGTSGAIVVHLARDQSVASPGIRIENNEIWNITTRTQWRDGVGIVVGASVDVVNNTFRNIEHYGIRVEDEGAFGGQIVARIEGNGFSDIGVDAVWSAAGQATLDLSNNSGVG